MRKFNQNGFGTVEMILVLIIVALIGVVGYMVYRNHNKTKTASVTTSTTPKTTTPAPTDPYAGWKTATLQYEKIAYKYPSDWTVKDTSIASPENENVCVRPGRDQITLSSPSGDQMYFSTGFDCSGSTGETNFGSLPIKALGQDLYLIFNDNRGPYGATSPSGACLAPTTSDAPNAPYYFKSKNIFASGAGTPSTPSNSFCYSLNDSRSDSEKNTSPPLTIKQIEDSKYFNAAKLIFESMKY